MEQGGELGAGGCPVTLAPARLCEVLQPPQAPPGTSAQGWAPIRRNGAAGGAQETGPSIVHIPSHLPPLHLPKLDIAMKKD